MNLPTKLQGLDSETLLHVLALKVRSRYGKISLTEINDYEAAIGRLYDGYNLVERLLAKGIIERDKESKFFDFRFIA